MNLFNKLQIGDLSINLPVIQGGMGVCVSLSGLASSVADQGGVGVIAAAGIGMREPGYQNNFLQAQIDGLRKEIRKAKEMTKGILGVNIMVALSNYADLARTAIEEKIDIIFSGAGLPLNLPAYLGKECKTKLVPIVSSARAANVIIKKWIANYKRSPDAIVVEGPMAGGHLGFKKEQINDPDFTLEKLIREVIQQVRLLEDETHKTIPVIAAGGVYTGGDVHRFLQMGAAGVQMATRFVTTHECDASPEFKEAFISSKQEDLVIIDSPVGMPGRAIRNQFIEDVLMGKKKPFACPYQCIRTCNPGKSPYCIALALTNAFKGRLKNGFAFAGANAYRAKQILSVKEVIASLKKEYILAANIPEKT